MASGGNINITVSDGGSASVIVPGASVQLVIGCSSSGTAGQLIVTRNPATLQTSFGQGPLPEAAALTCLQGGTVIAIKAATNSAGTKSSVTTTSGGTSVITATGVPVDSYNIKVLFTTSSGSAVTVGTAGAFYQISLDAGRNYGPVLALGTANSAALGVTGITLNFAAGNINNGQSCTLGTTEPLWSTAGVLAALNAFQASQYAVAGVGSIHIVGGSTLTTFATGVPGADATTIQGYLDTLATGFVYTRAFISARDASPPTAYGGTPETDATWQTAILADYAAVSARRLCVGAAYWNMPTAFPNPASTGAPALRRSISYAAAAKQVVIPPQRHNGRVKDGAISNIVVNPLTDPQDGFVYHDERINPGLDYIITGTGGRFMSTMTRTGLPGVYITNPLSMAPLGSDFFLMPLGNVMDVFASIVHQIGQLSIDDDVRINANGTIYENDARAIESVLASSVNSVMFAQKMISQPVGAGPSAAATGSSIIVDRTTNVRATSTVNISGQIIARGYILTINATLSFQNPNAAV